MTLRNHPNILDHVENLSEINSLTKTQLISILGKLSIPVQAATSGSYFSDRAQQTEDDLLSDEPPAFTGALEFAIDIGINETRHTGKLIVEYEQTPEWPFFDEKQDRIRNLWPNSSRAYYFMPTKSSQATKLGRRITTARNLSKYVNVTELLGTLNDALLDRIEDLINEECLRDVAKRLRNANPFITSSSLGAFRDLDQIEDATKAIVTLLEGRNVTSDIEHTDGYWYWWTISPGGTARDGSIGSSSLPDRDAALQDIAWRCIAGVISNMKAKDAKGPSHLN